jgi:hypothetical protein
VHVLHVSSMQLATTLPRRTSLGNRMCMHQALSKVILSARTSTKRLSGALGFNLCLTV